MADTAFQIQYRQEFIQGFEVLQSLVRDTVVTEATIKGNQATFLVADSGGATAKTRGVNGLIPARDDALDQFTATLQEWHDLVRKTNFNIFASQGDQRRIMQETTMAVINRKIDSDIITALETATLNTGAAVTASIELAAKAKTILGNNDVPYDGQICALITPAFEAYLMQTPEFANADYITNKPFNKLANGEPFGWGYYEWMGVKWIVHPNLTGVGTNAEKCIMYHRNSVGHAVNIAGIDKVVGYNEEQAYSYARCSLDMGSIKMQNEGIVVMNHDGSAYVSA